ncbi:MAG: shikimate kinase [Phycisphaerales bacterium]|nr:AAA family ATPase [Planctomycetota bacterium]
MRSALNAPRFILLGLRGSGKSTLGRLLAQSLRISHIDLDDLTAAQLRQPSAGDAIRNLGLPAFRAGEIAALQTPSARDAGVLSLGGGTPVAPEAREILAGFAASGSVIVYLRAAPETLRQRLAQTDLATRPSLTGAHPLAEIDAIFAERDPIFVAVATETIDVDRQSQQQTLQALLALSKA